MGLKVIGAGFGRTGTHSLKIALEVLGFKPCYHMVEVFSHPGHSEMWEAAAKGETIDWNALIGPYNAAVDWPSSYFWREHAAMFPDAKIILTERDPEDWYRSISQTIFEFMSKTADEPADPVARAQRKMGRYIVSEKVFGNRFDKEHVLDVYRKNNLDVRRELPKDRLLIFDAPDGWKPLCDFLGVPLPAVPYPLTNTTNDFRSRAAGRVQPAAGGKP